MDVPFAASTIHFLIFREKFFFLFFSLRAFANRKSKVSFCDRFRAKGLNLVFRACLFGEKVGTGKFSIPELDSVSEAVRH